MNVPDGLPDYAGGGLVNLMASLLRALGGQPEFPELRLLPAADLTAPRRLVLLVIDGLGADWLARRAPDGLLSRHRLGAITTVFPTTTAAAIPTLLTGDPPLRHGLTGWHTYLGELGCVMTVLPGTPRHGGVGYRRAGIDPARLFERPPFSERIAVPATLVAPDWIAGSDFNQRHAGPARILAGESLDDLLRQTWRALCPSRLATGWRRRGRPEREYFYVYWPGLDTIGHAHGMESAAALEHLGRIEQALARFMHAIAGTDTLVLVTADHGQVDTTPEDLIDLADHPDLESCLALPLCGEPRAALCYLRPDRVADFDAYCREVLGDRVAVWPSRDLQALGLFGTGTAHPRFRERIGERCLLPRGHGIIRQWLPFDERHVHAGAHGAHGGLSAAELWVPLCRLAA